MNRRRFIKVAGLAGLAVMAPSFGTSRARAQDGYKGPYWIMLNAGGGWDPTMCMDPKGGPVDDWYTTNDIIQPGTAGPFAYAPLQYFGDQGKTLIFDADSFFKKNHGRLRVINGVDNSTNNHDAGSRTTWSGQLSEGYPSFAALAAAVAVEKQSLPLAYLSNGGYDATQGVVSLTRVGDANSLARIAHPNMMDPSNPDTGLYHTNETAARILATQNARLAAMGQKTRLPVIQKAANSLYLARQGDDGLAALADEFLKNKMDDVTDIPGLGGLQNTGDAGQLQSLMNQAQVAMFAFMAGVAVSANLDTGGFDTHSNHDQDHTRSMGQILKALEYIFMKLDAYGLADKTYVMLGSDFGRTPYYNDGKGKDHWNITTVLAAGPGIPGDKLVGGTTDDFKALTWNNSLSQDPNGIRIEPKHIHAELRKLAGVDGSDLANQFPIDAEPMPVLTG